MSAFRRKGRRVHALKLPTERGEWLSRTTGTRDAGTAKKMQRMLDDLGPMGERAWDVLSRLEHRTMTVGELLDLWGKVGQDLIALRKRLDDIDLEPMVEAWHTVMAGPSRGVAEDTADHYLAAVRSLLPAGERFERSRLTPMALRDWIAGMTGVTPATVRKRGQGMRTFTEYLVGKHVLTEDPMRDVKLPPQGRPRVLYLETVDAKRLADAQPAPYSAFAALLAGSGIEVSVALELRKRDVDEAHREIRAAGTKTHARDRVVRVADWAWEYVKPLLKGRHADAKLFDTIPHRWSPRDVHAEAIEALVAKGHTVYAGYTMRDHRHTYAVRAIRAGTPAELVARQLGHVNAVLVHQVYGRFSPNQDERDKWEKIAAAQDVAAAKSSRKSAKKVAP